MTVSIDQYASASDAAAAYQTAVRGSKAAPGFNPAATPNLGQEAFAGTSQVGDEMHFGLGARDGRLIMSATHAGDIPVTPDNSNNLISLGGEELTTAKQVLGPSGSELAWSSALLALATAHRLRFPLTMRSPGSWLACFTQSANSRFVELFVLVDVEVAHVLLLRRAGRDQDASCAPRKKATFT